MIRFVPYKMLLRLSHVGDRVRGDIMHVEGTGESYKFWVEKHDKRDDLEDLGVNGMILFHRILKKFNRAACNELLWLTTVRSGGHWCKR
jgi:hypothetical protein